MTNVIDIGNPLPQVEKWETFLFRFHRFEGMKSKKGEFVSSPLFHCFNHQWKLCLYPRGNHAAMDDKISLFLQHESPGEVDVVFRIRFQDTKYSFFAANPSLDGKSSQFGWTNLIKRSTVLDSSSGILKNGALKIELCMKSNNDALHAEDIIPANPFSTSMLKLLDNEESADVSFQIVGDNIHQPSGRFHAHQLILEQCAPNLAAICESYSKSDPLPISDVDPKVFRHMLRYIYGGNVPDEMWKTSTREFINAADKYGVTNLKIEAEVRFVKHCEFTVENVVELLSYADGKSCALLKEKSLEFALKNAHQVVKSESFANMPVSRSITTELFSALARATEGVSHGGVQQLSVTMLRKKLQERGWEIDGTREMLVARLQELGKE